ncbi:MAG: amidohydrolase [Clostridia bacterium]|nr:amidohydrolase [Clostridia bacterium]
MIEQMALSMREELIHMRRSLHEIPETAFCENKTSQFIQNKLSELGIPYHVIAKTGVVGLIKGISNEKTVLLRADIDGLPICEESGAEYKSKIDGWMHACGHDVHTACLLGAAKILNSMKDRLLGNVKLVFQPAEEGVGGALPMIEEGVMENPYVDSAIALHVEPMEEVGNIQIKDGAIMASPDDFELTIQGKGGHGAYPHTCVDPIVIGSMIINAYQTLVSRHFNPMTPVVISVCSFHSGNCTNVIPDTAHLTGTARSLDKDTRAELMKVLKETAVDIAKSMGGECDFVFKPLYPPTINDKAMNEIIKNAAKKLNFIKKIVCLEQASMGGDDFAYFSEKVPGVYFKLGCGNREKGIVHPIHSPKFNVDEDALPIGAAIMAQAAFDYLEKCGSLQ